MILAAGMGTRLKPLTESMPKAMVPVGGQPLIALLLDRLRAAGADDVTVNVHHFADQIVHYLHNGYDARGMKLSISDETDALLDTGGGLRRAFSGRTDRPVLVHNVDILSNARLPELYAACRGNVDALLLVSQRPTQRYLLFDDAMRLVGWTNIATGEVRSPYENLDLLCCRRLAFAGIHVVAPQAFDAMEEWPQKFSVTDFYIRSCRRLNIVGVEQDGLKLLDVGKPEALRQAESFLKGVEKQIVDS